MKPSITLIISTYNRSDALELVLLSVLNQKELPDEIIIADDGSSSETGDLIEKFKQKMPVPLIHSWIKDEGFQLSKSRNIAINKATCDYIISIDGDILLHNNFIKAHRKWAKAGTFMQGSRVLLNKKLTDKLINNKITSVSAFSPGMKRRIGAFKLSYFHKIIKGPQYTILRVKGAHQAFWRKDILHVNGFDESYEGWGCEDCDLVIRLMNAGLKRVNFKGSAIAYHLYHPQASKDRLQINNEILDETIEQKRIKAIKGIDQYS